MNEQMLKMNGLSLEILNVLSFESHVYYQKSGRHYPVEIQFNTLFGRQLNNGLHEYLYRKNYPIETGRKMREKYESGLIRDEHEFKEVLNHVLSGSKGS